MKSKSRDQGFVSLLTAILISMLLLVITISLIPLETFQLGKSEDAEQTLRAYYAAEAGVEDAVAKVLSGSISTSTTGCPSSAVGGANSGAEWTCQQVSFTGAPSGKLSGPPEESAVTISPGHHTSVNSVMFEWHHGSEAASFYDAWTPMGCAAGECRFPSAASYAYAPPLELTVLEYPDGGFNANKVCKTYS